MFDYATTVPRMLKRIRVIQRARLRRCLERVRVGMRGNHRSSKHTVQDLHAVENLTRE